VDDPELAYLDGNSLGRLPKATVELSQELIRGQWGRRLIRGWNDGWLELTGRIGAKIAGLLGADADEVIVADSTSVDLYKLAVAGLRARPERKTVVADELNFPSDLHVLRAAADTIGRGTAVRLVRSADGMTVTPGEFDAAIDADTALVAASHVAFKSGAVYDMAAVTAAAHERGALALWDLSHSVGAMPIDLHAAGVDLAVGCTYKYLCGGPGAPAFLFVRRDLQDELLNPVAGWFGRADPFGFALDDAPAAGIRRFLTGTPPVLSTAMIEPGVDLVREAGVERLRAKSIRQTEFLTALWEAELKPPGYSLNSPRDPARRGSHVSLGHPEAPRITRALIERFGVIPDFRRPDNIRLGAAPLYTTFAEIRRGVDALRVVVERRLYESFDGPTSGAT
jgi:kynureninase